MKKTFILATLLLVTACGFEPVYGMLGKDEAAAESQFSQIYIENIPDFEGQYLRNALIDRFYRYGRPASPRYSLRIGKIQEALTDLDITKTADTTRAQLRLDTGMSLIHNQTGEVVLERSLRSITSYNILASEFSTRVSEQNTRENALDDLARQVELQLSLFFNR